jgi:hypothetical protein
MRRTAASLLSLLALATLVACGDDADVGEPDDRDEVRTAPIELGDGDEVWLRVETGGGFVPMIIGLRTVPQLLLFDDGRLVRVVEPDADLPGVVPRLEAVQLDESATAELLDTFAAVVDGPEVGSPPVTDLPSTAIEVTTDGDTRDLSIYALGVEDGLTEEQVDAREAAQAAIDDARAIDGAEDWVPEEWLVLTTSSPGDTGAAADPVPWPLADDRRATTAEPDVCTWISGDEVDRVLGALEGSGFATLVGEDGDLAEIALRPVLTGEETCDAPEYEQFVER